MEVVATNTRVPGTLYRRTLNWVEGFAPPETRDYRIESSIGETAKGNRIQLSVATGFFFASTPGISTSAGGRLRLSTQRSLK
jgi:hypothetical protein